MEQYYLALIRGDKHGLGPTLLRGALQLVSIGYGLAVRLRNRLFDWGWKRIHRAPVPVVSIGNLTLGGTGKTPCVEYVARHFRSLDLRVAILSRGYASTNNERNDEALVLEQNLPDVPPLQSPDRVALARTAVEELESEILLLDDGFQHRRLHRDLDIVLVDATCPWGGGHLFPRGLLREPASSLKRAHAAVLTRCDQVTRATIDNVRRRITALAPQAIIVETRHAPVGWINASGAMKPLADCTTPVLAFCGIGNPDAFRRTLIDLGLSIADFRTYPDHHNYTRQDVDELHHWTRNAAKNGWIVTTQKDLVKLHIDRLGQRPLWALQIQLQVDSGRELLEARLRNLVRNSIDQGGSDGCTSVRPVARSSFP